MSTTTIVAVTNSYNDTVTLLPPKATIEGLGEVIFHNNPRVEFDGVDNVTNFDHHVDFRITKNKLHSELMGNMYHHYPRLKRRTQYLNVFKFNKGRSPEAQLTIPHYYMATLREGEHVAITNFGVPKCDKVVIKEQLGARGSNQVVVPTNMLTTLLKHAKGKTLGEVKDMFPDLIYTDNSNWDMMFFDDPNDLFISELISNVKSEYRLLVGGDTIYGRERTIKQGPYPQANLDTDKFHTVQDVVYETIDNMFDETLVETLYAFAKFIDLPIGSIDLYSTTDGNWGIFEYSTQFAFHGANPNFIKQLLLDGVKQVLTKNTAETTVYPKREALRGIVRTRPINAGNEHVHQGVSSGFQGFKRGEQAVIIGKRDGYVSGLDSPSIPDSIHPTVRQYLMKFVIIYRSFINTVVSNHIARHLIRSKATAFEVTNIVADSLKDNDWRYVIEAGDMTLVISAPPGARMTLVKQGYALQDFITICSSNIDISDIAPINSQMKDFEYLYNAIANIHKKRVIENSVIDKSDSQLIAFVKQSIIATYQNMLSKLAAHSLLPQDTQRAIVQRVIGIDFVDKSGFDWCINVQARDLSLNIHSAIEDDAHPSILINKDVLLDDWLNVKLKNQSDVLRDAVEDDMTDLITWVGHFDRLHSRVDTVLRRESVDIVTIHYCNSLLNAEFDDFTTTYHSLITLLQSGVVVKEVVPDVITSQWVSKGENWNILVEAGSLSATISINDNDNVAMWMPKHETSVIGYINYLPNNLLSNTKTRACEIHAQLLNQIKRLFELKNIVN